MGSRGLRYDPVLAKKMLAEEGYPNGFELKFANTALPGTQFMVDIGTAIADMWTKVGVKVTLKHYEWGSFSADGAWRPGGPRRLGLDVSHRRPARRAVALRRRLLAREHPAPAGRQGQLQRDCQDYVKTCSRLGSELDKAKRTALTTAWSRSGQLVDGRADHRGHGLLRHQHQEGRPVRGRSRAATSWATCSSASRARSRSPGRSEQPRVMKRFIARRLMQGVVLLFMVATIVFFLGRLTGNPVDLMLPEDATAEDRAPADQTLGLDGPLSEQFLIFVGKALHGDLGTSIRMKQPAARPSSTACPTRSCSSLGDAARHGLGIRSAWWRPQSRRLARPRGGHGGGAGRRHAELLARQSADLRLQRRAGLAAVEPHGRAAHYILPVITLGTFLVAGFMRITRSAMLEVMESEFVKLARIKGLSETTVIWKHCLRNALIPVLTLWGVFVGNLITGAIVTETVFAWPGIGRLTYEAVIYRDFPAAAGGDHPEIDPDPGINLGVDILYAYVDPRIRLA
jgi:peptide/nickel transport system permease protein